MISMDHLVQLGQRLAADNALDSPIVIIESAKDKNVVPLSVVSSGSNQEAMYEVGWQAGRNEQTNGSLEQLAVIAEAWMSQELSSSARPSADPDRREILIISSFLPASGAEHSVYELTQQGDGRIELSMLQPLADWVESPLVDAFLEGYLSGRRTLQHQEQLEAEDEEELVL